MTVFKRHSGIPRKKQAKASPGFAWLRHVLASCVLTFATASFAFAQCTPPSDGLVGHWKMDESSGTTVYDAAGTNNGTLASSAGAPPAWWPSSGKLNGAVEILDINDAVEVAVPAAYDNMNEFTLAGWVKYKPGGLSGSSRLFEKYPGYSLYILSVGGIERPLFNAARWGTTTGSWQTTAETMPNPNQWYHVAVTYSYNGGLTSDPKIYVDGVEYPVTETSTPAGTLNNTDTTGLAFGNRSPELDNALLGWIDDLRIYDRILSADEIEALYNLRATDDAPAGFMAYDARHARMVYCDGTDWVHMGTGSYNPNAITLDGSSSYFNLGGTLTAVSDGKAATGSVWFKTSATLPGGGHVQEIYNATTAGSLSSFRIGIDNNGFTGVQGFNSSQVLVLALGDAASPVLNNGVWHHLLFSFDLTDSNKRHLYIDDIDVTNVYTYDNTSGNINFVDTDHYFGRGVTTSSNSQFNGNLADFWLEHGTYIDFSKEENRRKFISATKMPMYLGEDGSLPTGNAPDIFLTGSTNNWHTNKGTGGGFTKAGQITTSSTQPANVPLAGAGDYVSGLVHHWKLDETTLTNGSTITDSAGTANGTVVGTLDTASAPRNTGVLVNANSEYITAGVISALKSKQKFTLSAWLKRNVAGSDVLVGTMDGAYGGVYVDFYSDGNAYWGVSAGGVAEAYYGAAPNDTNWHLLTLTYDGTQTGNANRLKTYFDGSYVTPTFNGTIPAASDPDNNPFEIGALATSYWSRGSVDDVRIYDRPLSASEVKALYNNSCPSGAMHYNQDFHVMNYCNGIEWVAMGDMGGTPPTNGLVGYWKLDETSGTTAADSSGNGRNGTINGSNASALTVTGQIGEAMTFPGSTTTNINFGTDSAFSMGAGNYTLSAWVKYTDITKSRQLFGHRDNGATGKGYGIYNTITTGRLECDNDDNTTDTSYYSTLGYGDGKWHHIVCVRNGTNMYMYIDGFAEAPYNISTLGNLDQAGVELRIAAFNGGGNAYTGAIDEARIYNRALSVNEVMQLYYNGLTGGFGTTSSSCTGPNMPEGSMFYNATHNVMQYCNGSRWVGIGQ